MKILMLTSGTANSRMSHRVIALGRELVRRGHSVTLIAPSADRHSGWLRDTPADMDGVTMVYPFQLRTKSFLVNLMPYLFSASFEVLRRNADIVYLYKPTPATIPALLAKWFKGTPVALDMDDLGSEVMEIEGQPAPIWKLVAACERLAARQAKAIVAVSRLLEKEYTTKYPGKPVIRISNGVDESEFTPVIPEKGRTPRIIFFAILARTRILAPLFEALPAVIAELGSSAVEVEILGDGPKRSELEAIVSRLGLNENVHFRGWTRFTEVGEYAASGDIAICMMPDERTTAACSNQKVFQYQALGLATVVSRVGDLPLYVEDGRAGVIVAAGDQAGLSKALVSLLKDDTLRATLAQRGREIATSRYTWNNLAGKLEKLLETTK
ncbi:MAG TPA: glycosyltransferase family 4 protein [Candidatus Saccharimonadia bacterium]|nr:glycosyltransferase family 4 protein [Candidatus Saccharimonadia bacterium]